MSDKTMKITIEGVPGTWTENSASAPVPSPPQKFNAAAFFDYVRANLFGGSLSQSQVDGFNSLSQYLVIAPFMAAVRVQQQAYCMATFQWETASTMQPIAEYGGTSASYAPWYGRGYVQLTWEENYKKQQDKLGGMEYVRENLIPYKVHDYPDQALDPDTSGVISIGGMIDGDFTGKKLDNYINESVVDYVNARRIVNGTDRAQEIATMAVEYEAAIRAGLS